MRHGCHFFVYATSRTVSANADFFKIFCHSCTLSCNSRISSGYFKKGLSKLHSTFPEIFFEFFFNYLECHNILGLWKKYFPLFGKRLSEGLSNLPLRVHNRELWGEKFLLIKLSTFYYDWSEYRMKTFEHSTKKVWSCRNCSLFVQLKFLRKKNFWKELILSLVSDFQREILDLLAKNVLVCVLVCVWGWGLSILHSTCLEKHFEKLHYFEKFVVSYFFAILDGKFSILLHEHLAGLPEPPRRRIWETRLFWRSFKFLELLNFGRKKWRGCRNRIYLCSGSFRKFFLKEKFQHR